MISVRSQAILCFFLLLLVICGCAGKPAEVSGTVSVAGTPVKGGGISLTPLVDEENAQPGVPGLADIRPDGTYLLKLEPGPNGLAPRFAVHFTPPPAYTTLTEEELKVTRPEDVPYITLYDGHVPKQAIVEVKLGKNIIDVELIPRPPK